MLPSNLSKTFKVHDSRRLLALPGNKEKTLKICLEHFFESATQAIKKRGLFCVALSGGSTPKAIYEIICSNQYKHRIDWSKVHLFWSDERSVPPEHEDSNYLMSMNAGFSQVHIPAHQIHRMKAEKNIQENASHYESLIKNLPETKFDLIILGMGDDGHTASLFPHTEALKESQSLVVANYIPKLDTWRMTLSFKCINEARHCCVYAFGEKKATIITKILTGKEQKEELPSQSLGTQNRPVLWILDDKASSKLK